MLKKTWYCGNAYIAMTLKLSVVLLLLLASRAMMFFFNKDLFQGIDSLHLMVLFFSGLRFDLFTLVIVNIPLLFFSAIPLSFKYTGIYQRILNVLFYISNSIALALNFIDVIYFRYTQKRMTFDIFDYVEENNNEIISLIPDFIRDFWFILMLWVLFVFVLIWASKQFIVDESRYLKYKWKNYLFDTLKFIVVFIVFIIIGRGGLQYRPINIINAGSYTEPKYFPILLNTPFTIIKTKDKSAITPANYFESKEELEEIFNPVKTYPHQPEDFKPLNVVILIVESFSAEHSGYLNPHLENGNYKGYTPFLDSLMQQSLVYKGYANGEKSIDGIPAILSAIPSLMDGPYITSLYAGNEISSLAGLLKSKGYTSAFFHGGSNGTMGFESYTKIAGFDKYYGRTEYNDESDFDGKWGIFDEPFLQYTSGVLDECKKPFFAAIFTLSSHHPFTIPEKYHNTFPKGALDIHESIGYADHSIRLFFNKVSQADWFNQTLFIITADHTYRGYYPEYKTTVGKYSIPIIFYQHGKIWVHEPVKTTQQTDILPSILDYLGYDHQFIAFGNSVFDTNTTNFAISHLSGIYQLIQGGYVLKFDGERNIGFYDLNADSLMKNNLLLQRDLANNGMSNLVRAIKQQFDYRVVNNQLIIK